MTGLAAAGALVDAGRDVVVLDKGRSVGGRLATRRIAGATLDTGAQFFTVRSDAFAERVERWKDDDLVYEWNRGFGGGAGDGGDGHPRYAVRGGFNALAKHLAVGLVVRAGLEVRAVRADRGPVVLTAPVPQSLAMLDAGGVTLDPSLEPGLRALRYEPTHGVLIVLDGPSSVPPPGGVKTDDGPFSFVVDNETKGISVRTALTMHVRPDESARWSDRPDDEALAALLPEARRWFGGATVVEAQFKRWRYATPVEPFPDRCCVAVTGPHPVVLASDAFGGPKVEGAFLSGLAAAQAVLGP